MDLKLPIPCSASSLVSVSNGILFIGGSDDNGMIVKHVYFLDTKKCMLIKVKSLKESSHFAFNTYCIDQNLLLIYSTQGKLFEMNPVSITLS